MPVELHNPLIKPTTPPPPAADHALESAIATARSQIAQLRAKRALGRLNSWDEVELFLKYPLRPSTKASFFTIENVNQFFDLWTARAEVRDRLLGAAKANEVTVTVTKHTIPTAGSVVYKPQQRKAIDQWISLQDAGIPAAMLTIETGGGKTFVAGGAILHEIASGRAVAGAFDIFPRIIYFTKKPVVLATADKLRDHFKLSVSTLKEPKADAQVLVLNYQALSSKQLRPFFAEDEIELFGNKTTVFRWRPTAPVLVIIDEMQVLKKIKSGISKRVLGFLRATTATNTKWLFMSATPGTCLRDLWLFALASKFETPSGTIALDNMTAFLGQFAARIDKPNKESMKRFATFLGPRLISPPRDPRKYKSINKCEIIPFPDARSREIYLSAEADYIRARESAGEVVGDLSMAQFQIFRGVSELLKAPIYGERMMKTVASGRSAVLAVCYIPTVIETVAYLASRGVRRDQISIIWGGRRIITEDEICTTKEWGQLLYKSDKAEKQFMEENDGARPKEKWYGLTRAEKTRLRKTQEYNVMRMRQGRSHSEHAEHVKWLEDMMLNAQGDEERHEQVKRFLRDETHYCIYTFSAGGTGIDLDNQIPGGRPRSVISTICYWAEEFVQALGRAYRINTQSDVDQTMLMFENSIESSHVLKILAPKIGSINKLTGFDGDIEDALGRAIARKEIVAQQAAVTAESDELVDDEADDDDDDSAE